MQVKQFFPLALAGTGFAQEGNQRNLTQALAAENSTLSQLNSLLASQPALVAALSQAQNITVLAPNNEALEEFLKSPAAAGAATNPGLVAAILSYHILNGTYYASSFTEGPMFIPTLLQNETYTNVTGGQRVEARMMEEEVMLFSALKENSTVVTANVNFTGGTIHIINKVLSVPQGIDTTAQAANLTAAVGAIRTANVGSTLASARDLTVFVPNNEAFAAIGSLAGSISPAELAGILEYHVVPGRVLYSPDISNTSLTTLAGGNITVRVIDGSVYVNGAEVVTPDVLIANGVVHVIDSVLNPNNTSVQPDTSASVRPPAYSGASSATNNPFTSGVPAPTSTAPVASGTGGVRSTSTSTEAGPVRTAAVGAAALFGGMAVYMNL